MNSSIIGDESNQAALIAAWVRLTSRLSALADEIEEKQQEVRNSIFFYLLQSS